MSTLSRILEALARRQDLALVFLLVATVGVMIVPVPPDMLDVLIALSLTIAALVLIVAIYLDRATSFATFPAIILVATVFRLAISISTTRSVLTIADAGSIVGSFGDYVTGGNIAVGLVIFLIITIVQFVVITKGAERIAEVAARFVLDALPGRQMSIDADLRSGDIDADEARRRRRQLDKDNQFFGAMDGAMKFVKGDAIAGLLIVAVNLIGGIVIGMAQMHMSLAEAGRTYSLLTIGDGLVAQLPALLIALSSGAVITRVTGDEKSDLGADIVGDLTRNARSLGVAGVVVMLLGLVPGFPTLIFAGLGAGLAGAGYLFAKREKASKFVVEPVLEEKFDVMAHGGERLVLRLGQGHFDALDARALHSRRAKDAIRFEKIYSFAPEPFAVAFDAELAEDALALDFDGVPVFLHALPLDKLIVYGPGKLLEAAGVRAESAQSLTDRADSHLVAAADRARVEPLGFRLLSAAELFCDLATRVAERNMSAFIGLRAANNVLRSIRMQNPELADQIAATVTLPTITEVLRRLAAERVPLLPVTRVFETIAEWGARETDLSMLVERVRLAMRRQICLSLADQNRVIAGYVVEPDLEQAMRGAVKPTEAGQQMILSPAASNMVLAQIETMRAPLDADAPAPVLVTTPALRRFLSGFLAGFNIEFQVISFAELAPEFQLQPVGSLAMKPFDTPARAA